MAKHRYAFDEQKIARFLKERRGTGRGAKYKPWLTVQDVSSLGRSTRIHSKKTSREHHLLSDLETGFFLMLDWADEVLDIREQYPLDREVTRMLAGQMGIVHPRDSQTQTDIVMTTDLLVNVRIDGVERMIAYSVKPAQKLDNPRILEKLELERRFWGRESVSWHLVTDKDLPHVRIANLRWLHEMQSLSALQAPHPDYWSDRCHQFIGELTTVRGGLIQDFLAHLEAQRGFAPSEPMTVFRHLAANKQITFDLDRRFNQKDRVEILNTAGADTSRQRRA